MPQYYETFCLKCGRGVTSSMPHDLCQSCDEELRNPNSSALIDYIQKIKAQSYHMYATLVDMQTTSTSSTDRAAAKIAIEKVEALK